MVVSVSVSDPRALEADWEPGFSALLDSIVLHSAPPEKDSNWKIKGQLLLNAHHFCIIIIKPKNHKSNQYKLETVFTM